MGAASPLTVFLTTVSDREAARQLARALLELRVAACIQVDESVESFYEWKGEVCQETECRLWIKSVRGRQVDLEEAVKRLHPYELPQWIGVEAAHVDPDYLNWVQGQTSISGSSPST